MDTAMGEWCLLGFVLAAGGLEEMGRAPPQQAIAIRDRLLFRVVRIEAVARIGPADVCSEWAMQPLRIVSSIAEVVVSRRVFRRTLCGSRCGLHDKRRAVLPPAHKLCRHPL